MDLDDAEAIIEPLIYPDEDSGSAYETDSENEHSSSQGEPVTKARSSRASSVKSRGGKKSTHQASDSGDEELSDVNEGQSAAVDRASIALSMDDQVFEDALEWASNFQAPQSPGDIKDPPRRAAGSRTKRRAEKPANEVRAKRLKPYYNNDYRELLNIDIEDTVTRRLQEDEYSLRPSQIGSSIWTSVEKDLFFTALTRLGRDNIRAIASRIGSKSELQVQEYIRLLHHGINEKKIHENRLLEPTDMPAAIQISDECSSVLERAGDALAIRQERAEEKIEQTKWGGSWLLTKEVSHWIEKRRKEDGGEEALDEVLPAANLFSIKIWLELSEKIFMNPATPYEEENWQSFAETGETPSIRATAFEDFHSMAVNVTKRLVSTTLFCTMSRIRARDLNKIKHAEITSADVEAAVNILAMKSNSSTFWIGCARRCHLKVVNDESEEMEKQLMTYDEVEATLTSESPSRSRSTSRPAYSRPSARSSVHSDPQASSSSDLEMDISSDFSVLDYPTSAAENSDSESSLSSASSTHFSSRRLEAKLKKKAARKAAEKTQDAYTEAFDMQASQLEEARLWALLKQDPPFEVGKVEPLEVMETGKGKCENREMGNWREWVGFWSPWETMETPVLEGKFERNRARISRKAKREARVVAEEDLESSGESPGNEDGVSPDRSEDSKAGNSAHSAEGREEEEHADEEGDGGEGDDEPYGNKAVADTQGYLETEDEVDVKME
jgi:RNA polymerase I-specific transcription initiation factor RRN5